MAISRQRKQNGIEGASKRGHVRLNMGTFFDLRIHQSAYSFNLVPNSLAPVYQSRILREKKNGLPQKEVWPLAYCFFFKCGQVLQLFIAYQKNSQGQATVE